MDGYLLCSNCFKDVGLRLDAIKIGHHELGECRNCHTSDGMKLNQEKLNKLAYRFFVQGSIHKSEFGEAPMIQFNTFRETEIEVPEWLENDIKLISNAIGSGFFYYGPRLWMLGQIEPLNQLREPATQKLIIDRIINEYPSYNFPKNGYFFRLRKNPIKPADLGEYDAPPLSGSGRLDSETLSVMYVSQDLETCVHECRATVEDELYVATLRPNSDLKLLNLSELIDDGVATEFESLDMAVYMLFLAGKQSYGTARQIAHAIKIAGYDGIIYPSYFSISRLGGMPFETISGISFRKFPPYKEYSRKRIVPNIGLFGKPIEDGLVKVSCINKLILHKISYDIGFGPLDVRNFEKEEFN